MMLVFGCANIREDHYFKSYSKNAGVATNYFRLTVKANADLSSARYIAGYYDERAVDLFFNEIKSAAGTNQTNPSKLFMDNQESPGSDEVLKPLDPQQQGAFVMIFSTNAEAVANTIGNFAQSNVVADALTNLVNQDRIHNALRDEARIPVMQQQSQSVIGELSALYSQVPRDAAPKKATTDAAFLRILNAIASALGSSQSFENLAQAEIWFNAVRVNLGGN